MTDTYDLDTSTDETHRDHEHGDAAESDRSDETASLDESLGVTVPEDYVGAFVAEAFEDVERSTEWADAVDAVVADGARDDWEALAPREQVVEMLRMADEFDRKAVERFDGIPLDRGSPTDEMRERFEEGKRLRRNADVLRDGIAAAYADGYVSDDDLVEAVESFGFDTDRVGAREDALDTVANAYDMDFRPYGGTLMTEREPDEDAEEFEAW
ncbi:hypothetical protein [Halostella sp. PRR32]|uniref:hypothetical protein n=1 Tax=Halostella sp. PRR32 TaxID=3098147 RepID=UPI00110F6478|nr:hypothetical protein [Halostella sp. PRR32]